MPDSRFGAKLAREFGLSYFSECSERATFLLPRRDLHSGIPQRLDAARIEAFVPQRSIEGLNKGVVRRLPGRLNSILSLL